MTYKHIAMCGGREAGAHGINKTTFFAPAVARQRVGGKSREKSRSCLLFVKDAAEAPQVRHGPTRRIATAQPKETPWQNKRERYGASKETGCVYAQRRKRKGLSSERGCCGVITKGLPKIHSRRGGITKGLQNLRMPRRQ